MLTTRFDQDVTPTMVRFINQDTAENNGTGGLFVLTEQERIENERFEFYPPSLDHN